MSVSEEIFKSISEQTDAVFNNKYVQDAMEEYASNMGFKHPLEWYGLHKCVNRGIVIAICKERGIDPKDL